MSGQLARRKLLLEIARCSNVATCKGGGKDAAKHPCAKVVGVQATAGSVHELQVPEPWSGTIDSARLLFISSNPAISDEDAYPTGTSSDDEIAAYFEDRFATSISGGIRPLRRDNSFGEPQAFWSFVRARAKELGVAGPGTDYALTEVVHCKSSKEHGVEAARATCAHLYLARVLAVSGARTIVALGNHADIELRRLLDIDGDVRVVGPRDVEGRVRMLVFAPHANARVVRTLKKLLGASTLERVRQWTRADIDIPAASVVPPHQPLPVPKVDNIERSLKEDGWHGRPILAERRNDGRYIAWTGSNRLAAARKLALSVPILLVDTSALERSGRSRDPTNGTFEAMLCRLDDDEHRDPDEIKRDVLFEVGDERAALLMQEEIDARRKARAQDR